MDSRCFILTHTGVWRKRNELKIQERLDLVKNVAITAYRSNFDLMNEEFCPDQDICVDVVHSIVRNFENSGIVNAGSGSMTQSDGIQRMDASIMRGRDLQYGAVCSLRGYKNPISIAKNIMENDSRHNMYSHDFVKQFSKIDEIKDKNNFNFSKKNFTDEYGTVGAVSLDRLGNLCAGTSTGGFGSCSPGRIGDSCIIGAGNYSNASCAVSCTGRGESIVKLCIAKRVADLVMNEKINPRKAIDTAINEFVNHFPNQNQTLGIIALDNLGNYGINFRGSAMVWSAILQQKNQVFVLFGSNSDNFQKERID